MPIEERGGTLYLRASTTKVVMMAVVLGLSGVGQIAVGILDREQSSFFRTFLMVGGMAALTLTFIMMRQVRAGEPFITADRYGIHHRKLGSIPWADVTEISIGRGPGGPAVGIEVSDRKKYNDRLPSGFLNIFYKRRPNEPFLMIPARLMGTTPEELKARLEMAAGRGS